MNILTTTTGRKKSASIDGRLAVRQRFKLAGEFLRPLNGLITMGFATRRKGKTAFGRAMSYLLTGAIEGEYPNQRVNPALVRLSDGVLQNPRGVKTARLGGTVEVRFAIRENDLLNQSWDDEVIVCVYHPALGVAGINDDRCQRCDGGVTVRLPPKLAGEPVHVYLMVHCRQKRNWSKSLYLGEL